jgi:hypothetical protein
MNREEAIAAGATRFFGKPCVRGHSGERFVRGGCCVECVNLRCAARQKAKRQGVLPPPPPKTIAERVVEKRKGGIPLPKLKEADVEPQLMPLIELKPNQCRYPYDTERGVLFCGLPKMQATPNHPMPSYCPEHFALCTEP